MHDVDLVPPDVADRQLDVDRGCTHECRMAGCCRLAVQLERVVRNFRKQVLLLDPQRATPWPTAGWCGW